MFRYIHALRGIFFMLAFLLPAISWAASEAERLLKQDIDRQEQERRERRREELNHQAPPIRFEPEQEDTSEPEKGPCFLVNKITLSTQGLENDLLPKKETRQIVQSYQGRCLEANDLTVLQQQLTSMAFSKGWVTTRIVIPEQNLSTGVLQLEIIPGTMEAVRATSLSKKELAMASALKPGEFLQLRALEQTVDNLNRLASFQTTIDLLPGEKAGSSIADLTVKKLTPWQAGLTWQGEQLQASDTSQNLRATLTLDSPLEIADRVIAGVSHNIPNGVSGQTWGNSIDYDIPVGWWRLAAGWDEFRYKNDIHSGMTTFTSSGESQSWRVELARILSRDDKNRWSGALYTRQRRNDNFLDAVTIGVSSYRVQNIGLRLDHSLLASPWVMDTSITMEQGRVVSRASISPFSAHYWRAQANHELQYHWEKNRISLSTNAQYSPAVLPPSEQYSLTGRVAGYGTLSVNSERGLAVAMEWARSFTHHIPMLLGIGVVAASAINAKGVVPTSELSSMTLRWQAMWKNMGGQIKASWPLKDDVGNAANTHKNGQLDASLIMTW